MFKQTTISAAVVAVLGGAGALSSAQAQSPQQRVEVTGSRIQKPDFPAR